MAPVGIYSRLKSYYTGEKEPELPPINTTTAVALLVVYTLIYVLPFYIFPATRPSPNLSRDAPSVIRGRIRLVTITCVLCSIASFTLLSSVDGGTFLESLHHMGYAPLGIPETAKSLALTALLFLGPLFEAGIAEGGWRGWVRGTGLDEAFSSWIGYRNYVAGPVTEEVLFRSASVPLLLLARTSNITIVFLTPVVFGLAHFHHFYEFRITHPDTPVGQAVFRSVFQLLYTTLFGGYVTFLYMRTGSLMAVILVHAFCNWQGFPRVWGRVTRSEMMVPVEVGEGKRSEDLKKGLNGELGVVWTIAYYVLLVVGAVGWWRCLWPLSESDMALTTF